MLETALAVADESNEFLRDSVESHLSMSRKVALTWVVDCSTNGAGDGENLLEKIRRPQHGISGSY